MFYSTRSRTRNTTSSITVAPNVAIAPFSDVDELKNSMAAGCTTNRIFGREYE